MGSQRGFLMLELAIAALVMTLLAVWGANTMVNRLNDASAQASAVWMLSVKKAVRAYLERHAQALVLAEDGAALTESGYADWAVPTLAELKKEGLLSAGFPENNFPGAGATVQVLRSGPCPGFECRLEAIIHSNMPFLRKMSAGVDEQMVARWLMASEGWGGTVHAREPGKIRGAAFEFDNPPGGAGTALRPGTVALAITSEQLTSLDFLRVGDSRDPRFEGAATVQGDISTGADLRVQQYLFLGTEEDAFAPCANEGAVARQHQGGLLICRDHTWRMVSRTGGGGFSTNFYWGCANSEGASTANPVTGSCTCPYGTAMTQISDSGPEDFPEGRTRGYLCVD